MHFDKVTDEFLDIFFQIIFCLTSRFILQQLDNSPSFCSQLLNRG